MKRIGDEGYVERCVRRAIQYDLTLYAAHTNLDNASGGVCHEMAKRLGLRQVEFLVPSADGRSGSGIIGEIDATDALAFLHFVKNTFGAGCVQHNSGPDRPIRRVALCGGAGDFLIDNALERGADLYLTGEIGYHRFFGYDERMWLAAIGHYESERFTPDILCSIIREACPELPVVVYDRPTSPVHYL